MAVRFGLESIVWKSDDAVPFKNLELRSEDRTNKKSFLHQSKALKGFLRIQRVR